jgi:hypothetical protein
LQSQRKLANFRRGRWKLVNFHHKTSVSQRPTEISPKLTDKAYFRQF